MTDWTGLEEEPKDEAPDNVEPEKPKSAEEMADYIEQKYGLK